MAFSSADPNAFIGLAVQSALGTPQTTQTKFRYVKYLVTDFDPELDVVDLREGGDGLDFGSTYKKQQKTIGQISFYMHPESLGLFLAAVPGGATYNQSAGSNPAQHFFHTGHASFPWVTLHIGHPGTTLTHFISDTLFTGITIEGNSGEPHKVTIPFVAINHGASNPVLAASLGVPTGGDSYFLYHGAPSYQLDGTADSTINSWKFDLGYGTEELQAQAVSLDDIAVQNRDANVEVTKRYVDSTFWKKVFMGAGISPTISVATGSLRINNANAGEGGGQATRLLEISADLITWREAKLTELDPDGKTVYYSISGKALKGATHALRVALSNSHPSAYV